MSGEKDLDQLKKEAAAKAKAAALAKLQAKQQGQVATETLTTPVESPKAEASTTEPASTPTAATADEKAKAAAAAKAKAAAAAKAKAAALAKQQGSEANEQEDANVSTEAVPSPSEPAGADEKAKAAAAAKAKAAAAAKAKAAALAKQQGSEAGAPASDDEKAKAIAAAKAKAAAAAKAKLASQGGDAAPAGDDEKAKAIAAAKAKAAAAAAAKAKAAGADAGATATEAAPAKPSPNQQYLDKYVRVIEEHLGKEVLEDSYINTLSKDVPTLIVKKDTYLKVAEFLKYNEQLGFDYLSEIHGSDFETHMEIYVHLFSYLNRQSVALKVKIDRDQPVIHSITPLWAGANWAECEAYDLLGIQFEGHPNLYRIMLGEEWVGYPLRKDYEQYDVEV
jgi:NADH-quinone oxidoreductase subunit C